MKTKLLLAALLALSCAGLHAQINSSHAGQVPGPNPPTATTPVWLELVKAGKVVTCFYATGTAAPTGWTQLGSPQTLTLANVPLLAGIFITSHEAGDLSVGTIDNVSITPAAAPATGYPVTEDEDVGQPPLMGFANCVNGAWAIMGAGADIWNASDQFNFQPWSVTGDFSIVCRVTSIAGAPWTPNTDPWQKIGIMIRDSSNSGSDYAMACATFGNGIDFQYRLGTNDNPDVLSVTVPAVQIPGVTGGVVGPASGVVSIGTNVSGFVERP